MGGRGVAIRSGRPALQRYGAGMSTNPPAPRARGPRPAGEDTRAAILSAAQVEFAERGFDATSVRAVARRAGVDPGLVRHYFGAKGDLFVALNELPGLPGEFLGPLFDAGLDGVGRRIVALFFALWDAPDGRQKIRALIAAASSRELEGAGLAEFIAAEVTDAIAPRLTGPQPHLRAELIAANVVGLALARYVLQLEPLASASEEEVAAWLAPNLQRLVDGGP